MIICAVSSIDKGYGGTKIFETLSFDVQEGQRIGLVGPNGTGKTTILKLISGEEDIDGGAIHTKKGLSIGYLSQIPNFDKEVTGHLVLLQAFENLVKKEVRMKELESRMMVSSKEQKVLTNELEEYGHIQEEFTRLGGYEMDSTLMSVANGLGIKSLLEQPFHLMSGGEKTKICLGLILLQKPNLLLLDEPTNHLDIDAIEWLEEYIRTENLTTLIVSHDRYFLDQVVTDIYDLDEGVVVCYHGNYSRFIKEKEKRLIEQFSAYQEQQKKIKKMKDAIRRLRQWANEGNPPNEKFYRKAKSMEKALERMEKLKRPILEKKKMGLELDTSDRSGKDVFVYEGISQSFGSKLLITNFSFTLHHKERVAIVGKNGTGKSTLLKMVLGELKPTLGTVRVGSNVKIGYLSQYIFENLDNQIVIEAFRERVSMTEGDARNVLARFLFYGPAVYKKISSLSGGERMRLRLAQLMYQDVNVLILDEPTNHLDIDSREVLEETLQDFEGSILCVSHDRYFLSQLFSKTLWLDEGKLTLYLGNYEESKQKRSQLKIDISKPKAKIKGAPFTSPSKEMDFEKAVATLEKRLEELEATEKNLEKIMMEEQELSKLQSLQMDFEAIKSKIEALYDELAGYYEKDDH